MTLAAASEDIGDKGENDECHFGSHFDRWRFLQKILEADEDFSAVSASLVNRVLYRYLQLALQRGIPYVKYNDLGRDDPQKALPALRQRQEVVLRELLERWAGDKSIPLLQDDGDSKNGWKVILSSLGEEGEDDLDHLLTKLTSLLPALEETSDEDDDDEEEMAVPTEQWEQDLAQSLWDFVAELYGPTAVQMEQEEDSILWNVKNVVVRLLLHYDFLTLEDGEYGT